MAVLRHPPLTPLARAVAGLVVLLAVFVFLAVSPAPVAFPDHHWEILLLLAGGAALLLADLALATPARAERAARGRRALTDTDELAHLRGYGHFHVVAPDGVIGIVDEILGDRDGRPLAVVVMDGWFGGRRFLVPLTDVEAVDEARRQLVLRGGATLEPR
ncbi:MAG TPA: PRC-barrel domain-containing protein [Gaiellaceae bacterium]|jgi:hypothetical protein